MPKYWGKNYFAHGSFPKVGQKQNKREKERKKTRKTLENQLFFRYLLVMPKYWGKQIFTHGSFPKVGQKQKTEKEKERNTPGTAGGPGGRDRTLAVKKCGSKLVNVKINHLRLLLFTHFGDTQEADFL